jgi:acetylornithine deacetylase/succinyl-diaminopimelate desuccinylase-like protein
MEALDLARALIRRPSVTPADAGALDVLEAVLKELGFSCHRLRFGEIDNLYARLGVSLHISALPVTPMWCRWERAGHKTPSPPR